MVRGPNGMDEGRVILRVECCEPDGTYLRTVRLPVLTPERLKFYYEKSKQFDVLFTDHIDDFTSFANIFFSQVGDELEANGIVWEIDDVGILFLRDIRPGLSADGHFTYWDRRLKGREELLRQMLRYVFDTFKFHRIYVEVGLYAAHSVGAYLTRVGFKKEGRQRESVKYKGEWFDANQYSILEHEV